LKIEKDMADFPKIDYQYWFNNYSWEGFSSMKGMISTMINKAYIDLDITELNITDKISQKIIEYSSKPNDDLLFEIFKLIQTWGGKSAGRHTLNIVQNWNVSNILKYKTFVDTIKNDRVVDSFNYLIKIEKIKGLSYSFVPKHICFWSGKGDRTNGYPILDDVIAILVYNTKPAKNVSYEVFINDISNFAKKINKDLSEDKQLTMAQIEMALFAFSGYYWKTRKTGTNEFKINKLQNHKDLEEAIRISKR
jgi:hypothetical protein